MATVLFEEEQSLKQNHIWLIILLVPLSSIGVLIYQLCGGTFETNYPMSNTSLIILTIAYLLLALLALRYVKLTTIIDDTKIAYGWNIPTADLNSILINEIKSCSVIRYKFVGYGYRISFKYGTIYNVSGNKGLQIITHKNDKVLIGSNREDELAEIVKKIEELKKQTHI
jgi:hypothetical protein